MNSGRSVFRLLCGLAALAALALIGSNVEAIEKAGGDPLPYWEEPEEEKDEEKTSSDKAEKTGKTDKRVEAPAEDADAKSSSGKTA